LPPLDSLPAEQLAGLASQLFIQAKNTEAECVTTAHFWEQARKTQEENLQLARQDSTLAKSLVDSLTAQLKSTRAAERQSAAKLKKAQKVAALCEKTAVMGPEDQRKNLPKAWRALQDLQPKEAAPPVHADMAARPMERDSSVEEKKAPRMKRKKGEKAPEKSSSEASAEPRSSASDSVAVEKPKGKSTKTASAAPQFATYDPSQDVMLHPPTPPCYLAVNTRDEFTGAALRQVQAGELFRFTNPVLKTYLEGKNQIFCTAALATAGSNASLLLTFQINDPNVRRAFGNLAKNSLAVLTFTDGAAVSLYDTKMDEGLLDPGTRLVTYQAQYALDAAAFRKVRNTELDKVRIAWSTGYEDYDIQQVDLLMRQAACLGEKP